MEFLSVVDKNDKEIGTATKEDVYKKKLTHRIIHVLVFNEKNEMALQLRSSYVSFCPNHWCTSTGGHVQRKETYINAANRELKEELGIKSNLELLGKEYYEVENTPAKFLGIFKTKFSGNFHPDSNVVSKIKYFSINKIKDMIINGEKFHPELLFIIKKYF